MHRSVHTPNIVQIGSLRKSCRPVFFHRCTPVPTQNRNTDFRCTPLTATHSSREKCGCLCCYSKKKVILDPPPSGAHHCHKRAKPPHTATKKKRDCYSRYYYRETLSILHSIAQASPRAPRPKQTKRTATTPLPPSRI